MLEGETDCGTAKLFHPAPRRAPAVAESSAVVMSREREPLTPAQLADLVAAWAELQQVAKEAGVT